MQKAMLPLICSLLLVCFISTSKAQETLRVMTYNVLHFPSSNPVNRQDTLNVILDYKPIDMLVVQELSNENGANILLSQSLNRNGNNFSRAAFVSQQSNGGSDQLQQLVFYRDSKFVLHSQSTLITETRDINEYIFYINDPNLFQHQDTVWLDVYVCHLKASQGFNNEQERLRNVQVLQDHLLSRPQGRNVIFAGDFNVYRSNEPAYQALINPSQGVFFVDPINQPGEWHNNSSLSFLHTQATRENQIFGDGVGGGMDDRFDFILMSENMEGAGNAISYVSGSYETVGQSGNCYNENIIDCVGGGTPQSVRTALYHFSDHLPVYAEFDVTFPVGAQELTNASSIVEIQSSNIVSKQLNIKLNEPNVVKQVQLVNVFGQKVVEVELTNQISLSLNIEELSTGLYFLTSPQLTGALKFYKK